MASPPPLPPRPASCSLPPAARPPWAIDQPLHPIRELHPLLQLPKALLINTPFIGAYHSSTSLPNKQRVALAVFARFDLVSEKVWIAVRWIWTTPTERDRKAKLMWCRLGEWSIMDEVLSDAEEYQVVVPKGEFVGSDGRVSEERVRERWLEGMRLGVEGFRGLE